MMEINRWVRAPTEEEEQAIRPNRETEMEISGDSFVSEVMGRLLQCRSTMEPLGMEWFSILNYISPKTPEKHT